MIVLPMSPGRYRKILAALEEPSLRIKLAPNPTTMGPSYISEMISKVLSAKSVVNELAEEVERAYTKSQILQNDLETEVALRTDMELNGLKPHEIDEMDAATRKAYIRQKVEKKYNQDSMLDAKPNAVPPGQFQLWFDLRNAKNHSIELKALLKMLDRRRDELCKLDSGVRLQQKTIDTEVGIHRSRLPRNQKTVQEFELLSASEPDAIGGDGQDAVGGDEPNVPKISAVSPAVEMEDGLESGVSEASITNGPS